MALEFAHGSFQWLGTDALNADKVVSGLSFAPVAIRLYLLGSSSGTDAAVQNLDGQRCVGFATSTSSRRCAASWDQDAAATTACSSVIRNDAVMAIVGTSKTGRLDVQSFDSGGFTLNIDEQSSGDFVIFWEAWGGSDITNVECGDFAEPAATGDVDYVLTGAFQPDVVMFAGVQSTAAVNTAQAESSGFYIGFASGTAAADNIVATGAQDHASASTDTDGYALDGECLAQIALAGGNPTARATLNAWNSDGFQLNWIARATTGRKSIFLAIKGGSWKAGSYTINGNTLNATATVSGLSFTPIGVSLIGALRAESTAGTSTVQDVLMAGTGSSTSSRRSQGYRSEDATASSAAEVDLCVEFDQVLAAPSATGTLLSAYDINAMNSDGFQIIVDTAGGVASEWQGYLTYGNVPAVAAEFAAAVTCEATVSVALTTEITMAAAVSASVTVAAPLTTAITFGSAVSASATTAADLTTGITAAASVNAEVTVAAALTTDITLAAAVNITATVAADLTFVAAEFAASVTATATTAATLTTNITLASAVSGSTTVAGDLSTSITLAAAPSCTVTVAAALSTSIPFSAAVSCTTTTTANLSTAITLAGALSCTTTAAAGLTTAIQFAAAVSTSATVSAPLTTAITLSAAVNATATVTGELEENAATFAASVNVTVTVAAALTTAIEVAASVNATVTTTADLATDIALASAVSATAAATSDLTTSITLAAAVSCTATPHADLEAGGVTNFYAAVTVTVTTAAALTTDIPLAAAASITTSTVAALSTAIEFGSSVSSFVTVSADLLTLIEMAASVSVSATTTADLEAEGGAAATFAADVAATATVTADLTTDITFSSAVTATASVYAALSAGLAPPRQLDTKTASIPSNIYTASPPQSDAARTATLDPFAARSASRTTTSPYRAGG